MNYEFKLPDIGEGLTEGEVVRWHVKEGDAVRENQPLCSVLTDKAEVEIPSPKNGTVRKLYAKPGEKIRVHAALVDLEVADGSAPASKAAPAPKKEAAKPAAPATPAPVGAFEFLLPDIGEGLTEGEITRWHVKEGDSVKENQPLCNVLTDKAEVEVPSPKSGKVVKLYAKPGQKIKVHSPLVALEIAGGAPARAAAASAPTAAAKAPARTAQATVPGHSVSATPMVRKLAQSLGIDISSVPGTGPQGRVLEADVRNFSGGSTAPAYSGSVNATPAVQRLARDLGVNLASVKGTGPGGRIAEWDVRKNAPTTTAAPTGVSAPSSTPAAPRVQPLPKLPGETRTPFVGIRRKIAERLHRSVSTVVAVTHMEECDMTALVELRGKMKNEAEKKKVKLTYLPFIIKALVKALKEFPNFNASLDDASGELVVKSYYNVGIAVNAGQGLIVPNIKDADKKDLWALAGEVQKLAETVRAGKIDVSSLQGGSITITNIGALGGLFATPIINHPEAAILGVMKLQKRPAVREDKLVIRDMTNLVLTFDHRINDGADAASFMNTVIKSLENPRTLL